MHSSKHPLDRDDIYILLRSNKDLQLIKHVIHFSLRTQGHTLHKIHRKYTKNAKHFGMWFPMTGTALQF